MKKIKNRQEDYATRASMIKKRTVAEIIISTNDDLRNENFLNAPIDESFYIDFAAQSHVKKKPKQS